MRTLIVGQVGQPTGMARVTRAIADQLADRRDVHVLGIDVMGGPEEPPTRQPAGWMLHPNPLAWDVFAEVALARLVEQLRPDSTLLYHDPWVVPRMRQAMPGGTGVVGCYCPIDGDLVQPGLVAGLATLDGMAVPTEFGRRRLLQRAAEEGKPALASRQLTVIPHGLSLASFRPLPGELGAPERRRFEARRALYPDRPDLWPGFWVLNGNRNHARKRLDLTLRGFAIFAARTPPDVRLYLHWGAERIGRDGVDVVRGAQALGIADRVVVGSEPGGVSTERLNLIYNAADVGVNTASGEGWGLVSFEHAATGAPQIVPAHSACAELWAGAAELLPVRRQVQRSGMVTGGEVDADDLAAALTRLHHDRERYQTMASQALARAHDPALRWEAVGEAWHAWLRQLEARGGASADLASSPRASVGPQSTREPVSASDAGVSS